MWTSETMSLTESLLISGMGMLVVLCALSLLAVMIVMFGWGFRLVEQHGKPAPPAAPEVQSGLTEEETCAIVLAVICEELQADPRDIQITGIREITT